MLLVVQTNRGARFFEVFQSHQTCFFGALQHDIVHEIWIVQEFFAFVPIRLKKIPNNIDQFFLDIAISETGFEVALS